MQTDQYQLKHDEAGMQPDEIVRESNSFRNFNTLYIML
jgi:hypothetical protein